MFFLNIVRGVAARRERHTGAAFPAIYKFVMSACSALFASEPSRT